LARGGLDAIKTQMRIRNNARKTHLRLALSTGEGSGTPARRTMCV
jgi:hypothetical protein